MFVPEHCIEQYGDILLAWCKPIADEDFLLVNVKLNKIEKKKLQEMTANRRRQEWLTTRWLVQKVLSQDVEICYNENGKPEINNGGMSISISHCQEIVAVLIHTKGKSVGLDCETVAPRILKIKHKFAEKELNQILNNETENLTLVWCAKEAMFKLYAKGAVDFNEHLQVNDFDFSVEGGTFTGTILKETVKNYILQYKYIQNSMLVWVSE